MLSDIGTLIGGSLVASAGSGGGVMTSDSTTIISTVSTSLRAGLTLFWAMGSDSHVASDWGYLSRGRTDAADTDQQRHRESLLRWLLTRGYRRLDESITPRDIWAMTRKAKITSRDLRAAARRTEQRHH